MTDAPANPFKGPGMEGFVATWYARQAVHDREELQQTARRIAELLNPGSRVLEIAPGPGYLAIALAKLTGGRVTGLDISQTFVPIMRAKPARRSISSTATPPTFRFPTVNSISLSAVPPSRTSPDRWSRSTRCTAWSRRAAQR